jgi:hypothetical protein
MFNSMQFAALLIVCCTGGQIKDANYLVNLHDGLATEVTEGKPEELGGVLMDNTATNRLAMAQLELLHPQQLCMGCSAHALNLLFKDLAKQPAAIGEKRARGRPSASSNTTNTTTKKDKPVSPAVAAIYEKARMISMVVGDSAPIRSLLHQKQMAAYGRIKVIHANCPTRFSMLHTILGDILESEKVSLLHVTVYLLGLNWHVLLLMLCLHSCLKVLNTGYACRLSWT